MDALIYFALWAALIFLMLRFGCGAHTMGHGERSRRDAPPSGVHQAQDMTWIPPEKDTDPVCGKTVTTSKAKPSVYAGSVYYFCSRECREAFEAAPDLYVGTNRQPQGA